MTAKTGLLDEAKTTLKLAVPFSLTLVGNMMMGIVDTIVIGRYDSVALSGVAAGNGIFWPAAVFGIGLTLGMETVVAQAQGAGDHVQCDRGLGAGLFLAAILALVITPLLYLAGQYYYYLTGADAQVAKVAGSYLKILSLSYPFIIFFNAVQRYWQSFSVALPMTIIIIVANVFNLAGNIVFVYGLYGFPQMGAEGVALSTLICRFLTVVAIVVVSFYYWKKRNADARPEQRFHLRNVLSIKRDVLARLVRLGIPSGLQTGLEVGAFGIATTLAAGLGVTPIATHQVVLTIASFMFMFPLGLSSAAAVRVGHYVGAAKPFQARKMGWLCLGMAGVLMTVPSALLYLVPEFFVGIFTEDPQVVNNALAVIGLVAFFQIFDGIQIVGTGSLRGLGNTHLAMISNFAGHYLVGLPVGMYMCFSMDRGIQGIWFGLTLGLMVACGANLFFWQRLSRTKLLGYA
ncbi:MAG: MATE family efflux transporter [Oligoflexales bacterium]